jgi:hypothetical protein
MAQIKTQHVDVNGQVVHTEYYADGEYEQVMADEAKAQKKARNDAIAAQREQRYKDEVDIYAVRYKRGEVDDKFIDGLYAKIKAELPYEVE